ncbi:hypothetical protein G4D82_12395 [Flavobacterium sp. CYK-4]|uniref:hypothetical protein n=1 Tax=Flavobacterium lotistagni TaxID=2709660 RepID=UPI00140DE747|nr:hypothetical protein [Flavobacterium lotistagni]NHM08024.1 hypothetical protein [Flavobacterium lotistagni]
MKINLFLLVWLGAISWATTLQAQDTLKIAVSKTVSVEEMLGDQRQFLQLTVNKMFGEKKGLGLLSITAYVADYEDQLEKNEFLNTTLLYQLLYKGLAINSGVAFTSVDGMKNFAGLQFMHQSKAFSLLYLPSYFFLHSHRLANTAMLTYSPELNKRWSIYTHLQLHYNHDFKTGHHFRSYAYGRLGLSRNYVTFGLAYNFDQYGASKITKNNTGIFLKLSM